VSVGVHWATLADPASTASSGGDPPILERLSGPLPPATVDQSDDGTQAWQNWEVRTRHSLRAAGDPRVVVVGELACGSCAVVAGLVVCGGLAEVGEVVADGPPAGGGCGGGHPLPGRRLGAAQRRAVQQRQDGRVPRRLTRVGAIPTRGRKMSVSHSA